MIINEELLATLQNDSGQKSCSLEELKVIYIAYNRPKANGVKINNNFYISFESAPKVQLYIKDNINKDKLSFIEELHFVDATKKEQNILSFIIFEFWQGDKIKQKICRFFFTITPSILLNFAIIKYVTEKALSNTFVALLTAISVFIAIFSLFTISHEHIERKKLRLFENGKLAYYFSVDKNITELGVSAILLTVFGLLLTNDSTTIFWNTWYDIKDWIILILFNLSFFFTFIILRSVIEFYIHRPAIFILGDMKKQSLEIFDKSNKKQ